MPEFKFFTPPNDTPAQNNAENKPPVLRPRKENAQEKADKSEMNRRAFLKLMGTGLTVAGAAAIGIKFISEAHKHTQEDAVKNEIQSLRDGFLEEKRKERIENAREYINVDDMEVIGETFREQIETQKDHITLDETTRKAIYHNWQEKYAPETVNYRDGIVQGLERMRPWFSEIKKIFVAHDVPEEFIYLAIAESH